MWPISSGNPTPELIEFHTRHLKKIVELNPDPSTYLKATAMKEEKLLPIAQALAGIALHTTIAILEASEGWVMTAFLLMQHLRETNLTTPVKN